MYFPQNSRKQDTDTFAFKKDYAKDQKVLFFFKVNDLSA